MLLGNLNQNRSRQKKIRTKVIHHKLLRSLYHPEIWVIHTTVGYKIQNIKVTIQLSTQILVYKVVRTHCVINEMDTTLLEKKH